MADELVKINTGAMLYDEQIHYDPVGNVSAVTTVVPAGTDNQLFCYDEQNRLTWAAAGTNPGNPCGNTASASTFGGAGYYQTFSYDTLNRLTSGPLGSYTYGDSAHLHAATSVSSGYTASYDAAGDMQCRAPSSSTTCSGTPTGQQLTWDVEGRLATWQNTTTNPTVTAKYLYDGEGNRVVQQVTDSVAGSTTTTSYIGSLETYSITTSSGPTAITTTDYIPAGKVLAEAVNGTLSYLATSYQGSVVAALDSTGAVGVTASQLYSPYGGVRYNNGAMPTDYGYTGQRADASTGLDYYGARYYDPTLGQFTSADMVLDGPNRYGYVGGNPTTATDPSGHMDDYQIAALMGGGGFRGGSFGDFGLDLDFDLDVSTVQYAFDEDGNLVTFDGDDTVTTLYDDGTTKSVDTDTWLQEQGQEDQDFQDSLAIDQPGTKYYGSQDEEDGQEIEPTTTTTPNPGPRGSGEDDDGGRGVPSGGDDPGVPPNGNNGGGSNGGNGGGTGGGSNFIPNPKTVDSQGRLTNGTYTVNPPDMAPHMPGTALPGRSVFLTGVDADSAVLDAAQYADENYLWFGNNAQQATIYVRNGPVGIHGDTGELVDWITVVRTLTGFVHGWPSER